ncbi:hypothetical protein RND71_038674 [Anisodus tanguticus]|uniref:Legume lectin domain-containing protein n=1 Tax=Anisodus tanguticus TaxID=243964 RepID=A0AAE1R0Y0_9SOLA|nr:hypothetical protein RND71_038674 [Anisodus tanguticus]
MSVLKFFQNTEELDENDEDTEVTSQPFKKIAAEDHVNKNLVSGDLHVSKDAVVAKERDEGVNKDNVENTTTQSRIHVPSDSGKKVDESSMEFYGSISEMGKGMSNILDSEAEIMADFVDTLQAMKNVPEYPTLGDHGFAFVMAPTKGPPGGLPAHYIGPLNDKNNGNITNHIVAVESDTILSCDFEDINDNHVGININQMKSEVLKPAAYYVSNNRPLQNLTLISGQIMQAWVEYDAASKQMHVTLAPVTAVKPTTPLLSLSYDLSPIIKETMFIGFSSATGSVSSSYYVLGWSFKINGMAAGLDISKLPKLPRIGPKKVSRLLFIGLPMILAGVIIVSTYGVVYYIRRRKFAELIEVWEL